MSREEHKDAIEVSIIFHEGQRMFAVPKQPAPVQEPVGDIGWGGSVNWHKAIPEFGADLYTTPPAATVPLTARELELIDGMIEVQLDHAKRCDSIANRTMAEKQKGWDMERVALLQKLKEKNNG
jgi:hypothetical protein